jgi:stage III sporulation protein SpoIIIAA
MKKLKDNVAKMIHDLPDSATLEDIQYHLYVLEKIRNGQKTIRDGNGITQEEAKKRLRKWLPG